MKKALKLKCLLLIAFTTACDDHGFGARRSSFEAIDAETPAEVDAALQRMRDRLSPARAAELSRAVDTLTRVVPDKHDRRTVGEISPQFVNMVRGRNADEIIRLAILYRVSAPPDPR